MISKLAAGSELVRSGLFATRQNFHDPIPEGTFVFVQRGVHAHEHFLAGFFRAAGARDRWWVVYVNGNFHICVVGNDGFVQVYHPLTLQ
jgi:hypothetical protein